MGVWFVSENKEEGYVAATLTSRKEAGGDVVFTFDRTDGKVEFFFHVIITRGGKDRNCHH